MKRRQIMLDEELDDALARETARIGTSKTTIVRECVRSRLRPLPPLDSDPTTRIIGVDDDGPAEVDDVIHS